MGVCFFFSFLFCLCPPYLACVHFFGVGVLGSSFFPAFFESYFPLLLHFRFLYIPAFYCF